MVKNPPANAEDVGSILGQEDPLEEEMATHSSFLPGKSHGQKSLVGYSLWVPWCQMQLSMQALIIRTYIDSPTMDGGKKTFNAPIAYTLFEDHAPWFGALRHWLRRTRCPERCWLFRIGARTWLVDQLLENQGVLSPQAVPSVFWPWEKQRSVE